MIHNVLLDVRRITFIFGIVFSFIFLSGSLTEVIAQPKFILKRTKRETTPFFLQIYGGYNGVSDPGEKIQELVRDIDANTYGGVMIGMQAAIEADSIFRRPLWIGGEFYYHRFVDRNLNLQSDVYYKGEPGSRVNFIEEVQAVGFQVVIAYDVFKRFQIQVAGGIQYWYPLVSIPTEVVGLLEDQFIPTATVGGKFVLLAYDHGSIDINIRGMKGFGEYGSFEVQSLLGFTFNF